VSLSIPVVHLCVGGAAGGGAAGHRGHSERCGAPGHGGGGVRPATLTPLSPTADHSTADLPAAPTEPRGESTVHALRNPLYGTVLVIRIRRIHMFLGILDPDPLVRGMEPDPAPDPSLFSKGVE
jgi:hypothetical protein